MGRLLEGGDPLIVSKVGGADRADFSRRPWLLRTPFDGVVAVGALIAIGSELAIGVATPAHIHGDVDIASSGEIAAEFEMAASRSTFVVGSSRKDYRETAVAVGAIDVDREFNAIAHFHERAELDLDRIGWSRSIGAPRAHAQQDQQQSKCDFPESFSEHVSLQGEWSAESVDTIPRRQLAA